MRYDLRILWVEDTHSWQRQQQDNMQILIDDLGISVDIRWIQDADEIIEQITNQSDGFKFVDIYLIDYSLSNNVLGNTIINLLRTKRIDSDILFYSSEHEKDIRKIVSDNLSDFEGVYIANKDTFLDKSLKIIEKNAKSLTSILNIRGSLMDYTAENDFAVNSYLLQIYDTLSEKQKNDILTDLNASIMCQCKDIKHDIDLNIKYIPENQNNVSINRILKLPSYMLPLDMRYRLLDSILKINEERIFDDKTIDQYIEKIIKLRNTLAHKKLDVCKQQQYIRYYDNIRQYNDRMCPDSCGEHSDNYKISVKDWQDLRKEVIEYSRMYDKMMKQVEAIVV